MSKIFYGILFILNVQIFQSSLAGQNNQKVELYVETGNSDNIRAISISPDNKFLISGGNDGTIKLWDLIKKIELKTFNTEHTFSTTVFLSDSKTFIAGDTGGNITFWDVTTGIELRKYKLHNRPINSVIISPDNKWLASIEDNFPVIKILNIATEEKYEIISDNAGFVTSVAFSPNGKTLAATGRDGTVKLFDVETREKIKTFFGHQNISWTVAFSPDGKMLASGGWDGTIRLWNVEKGLEINALDVKNTVLSVKFSPGGETFISDVSDTALKLWDVKSGSELKTFGSADNEHTETAVFSPDGTKIIVADEKVIKFWDIKAAIEISQLKGLAEETSFIGFSPDGKTLVIPSDHAISLWATTNWQRITTIIDEGTDSFGKVVFSPDSKFFAVSSEKTIELWDVKTVKKVKSFTGHSSMITSIAFSPDGKLIASADTGLSGDIGGVNAGSIKIWDVKSGQELKTLKGHKWSVDSVAFSPNGKIIASCGFDNAIRLWDVATGNELKVLLGHEMYVASVKFSSDGKTLVSHGDLSSPIDRVKFWDVETGNELKSLNWNDPQTKEQVKDILPDYYEDYEGKLTLDRKLKFKDGKNGSVNIFETTTDKLLASLNIINGTDWIISTPEGRFDTNKSLDTIAGLHWIVNNEFLNPLPLDVFMRQYYEPGLLQRVMRCNEEKSCDKEFKSLPSIAEINRVQPKVSIIDIKSIGNSVDVTIEVENVSEEVSVSTPNGTKRKRVTSGAFDLRLFRDGQLVSVSTPKKNLERFIADASRLVTEAKASGELLDTPEDAAWRAANDIFKLKGENVKTISPTKIQYTFRNIKLPKDGREKVEFTAYAFNSDKVKSATTEPAKFVVPDTVRNTGKKGCAYLISIGVNASENPAYKLRYAANDARKMQEIVGARLQSDGTQYSEVVQISLISDYSKNENITENNAQKAIIKGVFSLLSGERFTAVTTEVAKENPSFAGVFKKIPNIENLRAIEPEDTLIITFSGHGYADNAGIFYMLPYNIGKNTQKLTAEVLQKTISSDELSLWMQDITAAEMIMIVDACHSSAAVQGDGFKPGPMGSRGLGQLAYDKDMKILSATQADNAAFELDCLRQGILSYALLQDGIISSLADADNNKQLFSEEWLSYAEKRVPELYIEAENRKCSVVINDKNAEVGSIKSDKINLGRNQKENLNLQQPTLFDFKRRKTKNVLFNLP